MKLEAKILIVFGVLSLFGTGVLAWRSFKIIFTSFPYQFNQELIDVKIKIQNNSASESTFSLLLNINEQLDDVLLDYAIALEDDDGNFTTLMNRTVNICKFLKQRSAEPALRLIYEDILKQGNFFKMCPIKKGTYSLAEYRVDEELLPSYMPEVGFLVQITFRKLNKFLFKGDLHGKIDKSKGFDNLKMFSLG